MHATAPLPGAQYLLGEAKRQVVRRTICSTNAFGPSRASLMTRFTPRSTGRVRDLSKSAQKAHLRVRWAAIIGLLVAGLNLPTSPKPGAQPV